MAEKEKKKSARVDLKGLDNRAIAQVLNDKYGANTMVIAQEAMGLVMRFFSTGSYELDFACGGGFPRNRIIEVNGSFSALKSTLTLFTAKNFLASEPDGLFVVVDMERSFDPNYASSLGLDPERFMICCPDSGEQAIDLIADLLSVDRETFILLDSIAAMVPTSEVEASADQQTMGVQARLINKLMRVATARLKRSMYDSSAAGATIVCINQLREKIGVMFGDPTTTPGGKGKDFAYSMIVRLRSPASCAIKEKITKNGITREVRMGQTVTFNVLKNKCGASQFSEGEFDFWIRDNPKGKAYTFNNGEALFRWAASYNVIHQRKGGQYFYGSKLLGKSSANILKTIAKLKIEREIYEGVLQAIAEEEASKNNRSSPKVEVDDVEVDEGEEESEPEVPQTHKVKVPFKLVFKNKK